MSVSQFRQEKPVDVWYTVCPVPSAVSIAVGKGELQQAFANSGVNLQSVRTHADRKIREAHYDQSQSNLFREGGNIPPIWSKSVGKDLKVIGLTWIDNASLIISLPNSGIRNAGDLKGKRLGIIKRPNDQIDHARAGQLKAYLTALKHGGVKREDAKFIDIVIEEPQVALQPDGTQLSSSAFSVDKLRAVDGFFLRALLQGEVDAIHVGASRVGLKALLGGHVVFNAGDTALDPLDRVANSTPIAFTVKTDLLESNPDVVTAYVAQNLRTARWAKANQAEARRYIARDTGATEEEVGRGYSPEVAAQLEPSLDDKLVGYLEHQKNFLLAEGFIKKDFAISDFIAREPLIAARKLVDAEAAERAA
jgi:ABC-type nitrate/sulfonate/bicarbonate transport system substrate-binding protein